MPMRLPIRNLFPGSAVRLVLLALGLFLYVPAGADLAAQASDQHPAAQGTVTVAVVECPDFASGAGPSRCQGVPAATATDSECVVPLLMSAGMIGRCLAAARSYTAPTHPEMLRPPQPARALV